jgi:hypothetical protein
MSDLIFYSTTTGAAKAVKIGDKTTRLLRDNRFYQVSYATKVSVTEGGEEIEVLAVELTDENRRQMNGILVKLVSQEIATLLPLIPSFTTTLDYKRAMAVTIGLSYVQESINDKTYQYVDLDTETT